MSIKIENVCKIYGEQIALNGISFSATKGEILGFLGPNGAGKSTTLKILTGYLAASSGTAMVCDRYVAEDPTRIKQKIGYLPESNPLYHNMYVEEFLSYTGKMYSMKGEILTKSIKNTIEKVGLTAEKHKKIGSLSKGYKQRVGLAQALIHEPEVLILDEPTNGFDPNQLVEIRQLIKHEAQNKTVIISTHIMQEVQELCKRVVIINKGNIVADDNIENIRKKLNTGYKITIVFKDIADIAQLQHKDIANITNIDTNTYILDTYTDIREYIFTQCAQAGYTLLEIKLHEQSLEQMFQYITKA
ncbi:MAG: ATP-binding cassette domain-containing protein [Cytophagales bacterium]|nr:ATP-binding cassette domain-containing protein [Cytophagales bacterium]